MPQLQSSGQIRLTDITAEFGGTAPHRISEYYRGGSAGVGDNNTNVPTTGQIRITNFYNAESYSLKPKICQSFDEVTKSN